MANTATRNPNSFVDPNSVVPSYVWPLNHSTEEATGKHRNVSSAANTGHTGLVLQQGDTDHLTLRWKGSILLRSQLTAMWKWYQLCDTQTIYLVDFAGDTYEILWTAFDPIRIGVLRNPVDPVNAPLWKWEYSMEFVVLTLFAGPAFDGGIVP